MTCSGYVLKSTIKLPGCGWVLENTIKFMLPWDESQTFMVVKETKTNFGLEIR